MTVTFATSMSEYRIDQLCHRTYERREARIIRALGSAYPKSIPAKKLMAQPGFNYHIDPVSEFIALCISFRKINQALSGTGWQAFRTGGTPEDTYWLSPIGDG